MERATRMLGKHYNRTDPRAEFYFQRARVSALLDLARAVRGEND